GGQPERGEENQESLHAEASRGWCKPLLAVPRRDRPTLLQVYRPETNRAPIAPPPQSLGGGGVPPSSDPPGSLGPCSAAIARHHGALCCGASTGSTASPNRGVNSCTPDSAAWVHAVSIGWSQRWVDRSKVPQWIGSSGPPPSAACAARAFMGPRWMLAHAGWYAPTSSMTRSNGPNCAPISAKAV